MTLKLKTTLAAIALSMTTGATAQAANIVETAVGDERFSTLVAAVQAAPAFLDLDAAVDDPEAAHEQHHESQRRSKKFCSMQVRSNGCSCHSRALKTSCI